MTESTDGGRAILKGDTLLRNAYPRIRQEAQKSLRNQGPGEYQGLSTPAASNISSVVRQYKRCSTSSSVYCCVPFAGRPRRHTKMYEIDTTAAASTPVNRPSSNILREYQGRVRGSSFSHPRRMAYQGYQGNLPLRADTAGSVRACERPHRRLIYLDILDMLNNNIRKNGGRA